MMTKNPFCTTCHTTLPPVQREYTRSEAKQTGGARTRARIDSPRAESCSQKSATRRNISVPAVLAFQETPGKLLAPLVNNRNGSSSECEKRVCQKPLDRFSSAFSGTTVEKVESSDHQTSEARRAFPGVCRSPQKIGRAYEKNYVNEPITNVRKVHET